MLLCFCDLINIKSVLINPKVTSSEGTSDSSPTVPDVVASTVEISSTDRSQNKTDLPKEDIKHSTNVLHDQKPLDEPSATSTSTQRLVHERK